MAIPTKDDLRREYLRKRESTQVEVRASASRQIAERLFALPVWKDSSTILSYVSFDAEVDTREIIARTLAEGKRLAVPVVAPNFNETPISELQSLSHLVPGRLKGIFEPAVEHRRTIDASEIELVLVPGLVFDASGGRLGLGGGYFDRLLPKMLNAVRIGLAFSHQIHPSALPTEAHDVTMHALLTEKGFVEIANPTTTKGPGAA
jgi:5-formyltetrahydrofolate cyclo-ligase